MTPIQRNGLPARTRRPESAGRPGLTLRLATILGMLAGIATACATADNSGAEATHAAQTIARMITDLAFQKMSAPSASPTAYAQPETAATATTGPTSGPTPTPTEIDTVVLSTPKPVRGRSTYSGSTPTTDGTSLLTRTLNPRCNAAFFVGATGNSGVAAGSVFTLTLMIRNVGTCTWYPSYLIYWHSGARMETPAYIFLPEVTAPNQTLFLTVNLEAPEDPKTYYQRWYFRDPYDTQFGVGPNFDEWLVVYIEVV